MSQTADVVSAVRLLTHGNTEESFVTIPTDGEVCLSVSGWNFNHGSAKLLLGTNSIRRAQGVASHTAGSSEARK